MAPLRVCVIGGGPGAMFFCHAWNHQRRHHQQQQRDEKGHNEEGQQGSESLHELKITCFEMKSTPGGVWRAPSSPAATVPASSSSSSSPYIPHHEDAHQPIYEGLWTNCAVQTFEFYDYTLVQHFDTIEPIPAFLPRADVNDYLVGRVTHHHPTFFQDYFVFDTQVVHVQETKEENRGFQVTTRHVLTGELSTHYFDRCIWAAGENCQASIPESLQAVFQHRQDKDDKVGKLISDSKETKEPDDADGTVCRGSCVLLHSSETAKIKHNSQGRNILLIGGAFSAEDLALQCVKWGATHVDVATRQSTDAAVSWTSQWPGNKVKVHQEMVVDSVQEDGTIVLKYVEPIWPFGYKQSKLLNKKEIRLHGIHTVIFCTGYKANLDMIDPALRPECGQLPQSCMGDHPSLFVTDFDWSTWKMTTKNNHAFKFIGDVPSGQKRMIRANCNHPDMHRGILFKNPHMMYLCEYAAETPLFSLDVHAWLMCSYISGRVPMPTVDELKAANMEQFLDQMHLPSYRYDADEGYFDVLEPHAKYWGGESSTGDGDSEDDDDDDDASEDPYELDLGEYEAYVVRLLCKIMEEGKYPGLSLGTYKKLNKNGHRLLEFMDTSYEMRTELKADYPEDWEWRTFRDAEEAELIFSMHTGTKARPLRKRWMDIIASDEEGGRPTSIRNGDI